MSSKIPQRPSDRKMAVLVLLSFSMVVGVATVLWAFTEWLTTGTLLTGIGFAALMSLWTGCRNRQFNREDREIEVAAREMGGE